MTAFATRYPTLFHVTERSALPGIAAHGLLSAARLNEVLGGAADLGTNRRDWCTLETPLGRAALRRQGMPDSALRSRLDPAITLEAWRRFINAQVFLCPTQAAAMSLLRAEPARCQAIIAFPTAALIGAGLALRCCPFNNGYVDRSPPDRRRLRHYTDYRGVESWSPGTMVREVVIAGGVPPAIAFRVLGNADQSGA